jgi:hypothetical protein
VKLVDLNLLLYAVNRDAVQHARATAWLEQLLSGEETIARPWVVILGFFRLSTSARIFARSIAAAQAIAVVNSWLSRPHVAPLSLGEQHWRGCAARSGKQLPRET